MKNLIKLEPTGYVAVAKWFALEAGRCGWSRPDVWAWAGLGIVCSVTTEAALGLIGGTFGLFTGTIIFFCITVTCAVFGDGRV